MRLEGTKTRGRHKAQCTVTSANILEQKTIAYSGDLGVKGSYSNRKAGFMRLNVVTFYSTTQEGWTNKFPDPNRDTTGLCDPIHKQPTSCPPTDGPIFPDLRRTL